MLKMANHPIVDNECKLGLYKEFFNTVNSGIEQLQELLQEEEMIFQERSPHSLYIATLKDIRRACRKINQNLDKSS